MAWIESHQTLGSHPKTRKAARALGLAPVHLMGHLHALWHWALDMADDGNLSKFDHDDIAIAAQWEGDPDLFVEALVSCGFGDGPGFLERGGTYGDPRDNLHGDLVLHDWWDYAGKLVARRMRDRERKAERREQDTATPSPGVPEEVQRTSDGSPEDVQRSAGKDQNRTEPNQTNTLAASDKPKRKRSRPSDWSPNAAHATKARDAGVDLATEAEQFANFHDAKGSTFVDWDKAFHTWLGNAAKFRKERVQATGQGAPKW